MQGLHVGDEAILQGGFQRPRPPDTDLGANGHRVPASWAACWGRMRESPARPPGLCKQPGGGAGVCHLCPCGFHASSLEGSARAYYSVIIPFPLKLAEEGSRVCN